MMRQPIINELYLQVKKQISQQEKLTQWLSKVDRIMEYSLQEISDKIAKMKELLPHLPQNKQQELETILQMILTHPEVGMVILFGSYSRGDWVEEYEADGIHFKYQSDFDLLVIVSETCKSSEQKKIEQSIFKVLNDSLIIRTPVSILVHDINFINQHLTKAQYFFSEIKKEGIVLYDTHHFKLKEPISLSNKERYLLAKDDYEYCFSAASRFFESFNFNFEKKYYLDAAFLLHQVTEKLYTCILLVYTRYKPNTHKLEVLRKLSNALDKRLVKIFPLTNSEEIRRYTLLCQAYVDARYSKNYCITEEELSLLSREVKDLMQLIEVLCKDKLNDFLEQTMPGK